jgi:hypothetical protein
VLEHGEELDRLVGEERGRVVGVVAVIAGVKSISSSASSRGLPISRTMMSASVSRRSPWRSATRATSFARSATSAVRLQPV